MNLLLKKDDEAGDTAHFANLDKSVVLQEARAFNESPINPRKCRLILAKIAYLVYQSETFNTKEATECFFAVTKLFQNADVRVKSTSFNSEASNLKASQIPLRQIVYLVLKELTPFAQDVIIVTSSLTKDINAKGDLVYRPNAIRALVKVTDATLLQSIERFMKQAIVDRNPSVSSAALVSALHLFTTSREVVKRWVNEVAEAVNSKGMITQYHALGLLYLIKAHDRMSVLKLLQQLSRGTLRSPLAYCMLIRYTTKMIQEGLSEGDFATCLTLLAGFLRHKSDMVVYEAARCVVLLGEEGRLGKTELVPAVSALQLMLVNHRPALRFAAIRTLNRLAMSFPESVSVCNVDMENLISDTNRSIATLAITTLLKTGNESSVDRLMKQISGFMGEISDEFKIIVVEAIRSLCLKFPSKQVAMLNFLSSVLRDEGGFEYKRAIVEAVFDILRAIPEGKEMALSHLCEFIEDCEFTKLAVRILYVLGIDGPTTSQPSKYIRYIYNRVILENATVRAAAVSSLARYAVTLPDLRVNIKVLLTRCLDDVDDEVRDRAIFYLTLLEDIGEGDVGTWKDYVANDTTYSWAALEHSLVNYLSVGAEGHDRPFDIASVPVISKALEEKERLQTKKLANEPVLKTGSGAPANADMGVIERAAQSTTVELQSQYLEKICKIPQLAQLGTLFKSSKPVALTESETEYVVTCIKHIMGDNIVFQFDISNTLPEILLENVRVEMAEEDGGNSTRCKFILPANVIRNEDAGTVWAVYERSGMPACSFKCGLKFFVKEVNPSTGDVDQDGYEDEYIVEDVDLSVGDYMLPFPIAPFQKKYEDLPHECIETYQLTAVPSIKQAVSTLLDLLGMAPCEGTETVKDKAATHQLLLSGVFVGGIACVARCRMVWDQVNGVALEVAVKSQDHAVAAALADAIA